MDNSDTSTTTKDKEPFKVRAELFAPTRFTRECLLLVLLAAKTILTTQSSNDTSSNMQLPRVGILGGGHIGSAVAMALLRHQYPSDKIAISTRQPERTPKCEALQCSTSPSRSHLAQFRSIATYYDNARLSRESDVLVLCMPPSQLKSVAIQIKHALCVSEQPTLVVSVLCGASRELLQKSIGSRLVTRAKVSVDKLKGRSRGDLDDDEEDEEDLKDEDDGNAAASSTDPVAGVGNGGRGSFAEIAAREIVPARDQEDVESLLQQEQDNDGDSVDTSSLQDDATRHARHVLFGVFDHQEVEHHHSTDINPSPSHSTSRKRDHEQLRLRPEREARGGRAGVWSSTDWDELLTVVQHVMRAKMDT